MSENSHERKLKVRCYYTDYVNHMIRFYLTTPESLQVQGKRKADISNWIAVQDVWRKLGAEEKEVLEKVYSLHYRTTEAVKIYCEQTGADTYKTWVLITKTVAQIAKRRGLV